MPEQISYLENDSKRFTEFLLLKGLSENSIRQYLRYYFKLENYAEFNRDDAVKLLIENPNPICRATLLNYIEFKDLNIRLPRTTGRKKKRVRREILTYPEVVIMAKAMLRYDVLLGTGFLITYYCGLRKGELFNISLKDFKWSEWLDGDQEDNAKLLITGKGNRQRMVLVPPKIMLLIYHYITKFRPDMPVDKKLFNFGKDKWFRKLNEFGIHALGKKINPHLLRHTRTTHLFDQTEDLMFLRDFLGHTSTATTQLYVHRSTEKTLSKLDALLRKEDSL